MSAIATAARTLKVDITVRPFTSTSPPKLFAAGCQPTPLLRGGRHQLRALTYHYLASHR
jgi:hypothetical protein